MLERILVALSGKVRKATLDGKNYLVAPATIGAEGVLNGNGGPGFYPAQEWAKAVPAWNMKPITNGHPKDDSGNFISAADPKVIESSTVGFLLNTKWDGKLKTECWFDEEKTKVVDVRMYDALVSNKITEVSTGVFVNQEKVAGEYNGTKYDWVAKDHQPDHLAVLMDEIGAFSVEMGAGLMVNQKAPDPYKQDMVVNGMSLNDIVGGVRRALYAMHDKPGYEWYGYVEDVFDGYAVYCTGNKLFKINYAVTDGVVTLSGEPQEVVRVVQYQTTDGKLVGNASVWKVISTQENAMSVKFDKVAHVNTLVGNGYTEEDRSFLMGLADDVLGRIKPVPPVTANADKKKDEVVLPVKVEVAGVDQVVANATPVVQPKTPTFAEMIANADPATKEQFQEMQAAYTAEKTRLIGVITANKANTYTAEQLAAKPLADLRAVAALAAPVANEQPQQPVAPVGFFGAAPVAPVVNSVPTDFLPSPTVNALFETK